MLLKVLKEDEINCKLSYEFGNLEAIKQCVIYGLGIALLPRIVVAEEIRKGQMVSAIFAHPAFRFYTQMIYAKKKWVSKAFSHFLELTTAQTIKINEV
jgi:DNA-binding transcriptional LysR family regulator